MELPPRQQRAKALVDLVLRHLNQGVRGINARLQLDADRLIITIRGATFHHDRSAWRHLRGPLAKLLSELEGSEFNPAMSYRNFHVLTALLTRTPEGDIAIVIGGNNSPWRGAQRHCAEWQAVLKAGGQGLQPFAAVTGGQRQTDDVTGIVFQHNLLTTCDDCRAELVELGLPVGSWMTFFDLNEPNVAVHTTFGTIRRWFRRADARTVRKGQQRALAYAG